MSDVGGVYDLGDLPITVSAIYEGDWVVELDGMIGATIQVTVRIGTPGIKLQVYVQTSLDDGSTPIDLGCLAFTDTGATRLLNFSGLTPKLTAVVPTDGAIPDNTAIDGFLGSSLRIKVVSDGTYGDTLVTARSAVR